MMRTVGYSLFVLAALVASAVVVMTAEVNAFRENRILFLNTQQRSQTTLKDSNADILMSMRGGAATAIDVDIESSDEEESDEEEEEETLAKATKKAAAKTVKKTVAAAMKPKKKKKKSSLMKFFRIPYIIKACLNPAVFYQMTVGYWKSLYNIDYMADKGADSSQDLRSALEQKARYGGAGKKSSRGRRKMKPGQAKTLSDLPQLNT
mmetsp:Transcript_3920/g.9465  ORF Transcript_3920/g.9465 Transcript_3920/m.9465 type:complete len:207 (+) Transcript_3920:170-790(+)